MNHDPTAATMRSGRPPRRAITMVEILVVISVMGLLMGTVVTVVARTLRAEAQTQGHVPDMRAAWQLADRFRADVHQALRVAVPPESGGSRLRIQTATAQVIEYASDGQRILRTESDSNSTTSRTASHLPAGVTAEFVGFSSHDQHFALLRLRAAGNSPLQYVAQVGRDHRFVDGTMIKP